MADMEVSNGEACKRFSGGKLVHICTAKPLKINTGFSKFEQ